MTPDPKMKPLQNNINRFSFKDGQSYYVYLPQQTENKNPLKLLVLIHGYSARKNNERGRKAVVVLVGKWIAKADENNWLILAPHFDEKRFLRDYQRLNFKALRSDIRLNAIIDELGSHIPGLNIYAFFLFGFSGGGQYVHRYVAMNPGKASAAVASASGWYMWPDKALTYPLGINTGENPGGSKIDLKNYCSQKLLILVGGKDRRQGAFRNRYRSFNLNEMQGHSRLERAENWTRRIHEWAWANRQVCRIRLEMIPEAKHRLNKYYIEKASTFFLSSERVS